MAIDKINTVSYTSLAKLSGILKANIANLNGISPPSPLFLDTYTGAVAAYSFRELNSSYSGYCVKIKNDAGTDLDVGFSSGYVDTSAISSHCGAGDGKIVTWYDQSGNGEDITQGSTSAMPKLYIGGALNNVNSKLAANFDGNDRLVTAATSLHSGAWYCTTAVKIGASLASNMQIWNQDDSTGPPVVRIAQYLRTHTSLAARSVMFNTSVANFQNTASPTLSTNTQYQISAYVDTSAQEIKTFTNSVNSNAATSYTGTAASGTHEVAMGSDARTTPGVFFTGDIQELIMWDSAQSANRSSIESNIDTYYSIP